MARQARSNGATPLPLPARALPEKALPNGVVPNDRRLPPDRMRTEEVAFIRKQLEDKSQAYLTAISEIEAQTADRSVLYGLLLTAGAGEATIDRLQAIEVGLEMIRERYQLTQQDQIQPDGYILRTPQSEEALG